MSIQLILYIAIPEFPKPFAAKDAAINLEINALQEKGKGTFI